MPIGKERQAFALGIVLRDERVDDFSMDIRETKSRPA